MHSACILLTGIKMGGMAPPYLKVGGGGGGGGQLPAPIFLRHLYYACIVMMQIVSLCHHAGMYHY